MYSKTYHKEFSRLKKEDPDITDDRAKAAARAKALEAVSEIIKQCPSFRYSPGCVVG